MQYEPVNDSSMMDEDMKMCKVCLVTNINTVCVPCGHRAMCLECSTDIMNQTKSCPICRAKITQIVKTFDT